MTSNDSFLEDETFDSSDEETWELEDNISGSDSDEDPELATSTAQRSRRCLTDAGYSTQDPGSQNPLPPFQPSRSPGPG